jgi:hypothetical protein
MWDILSWLFFLVFIAALLVVGGLLLRGYLTTGSPTSAITGALFGPKPQKRLDVVDQANVDGRRRLVLIRRDDVEHLIMTGGPVDVVIETNIGPARPQNGGSCEVPGPTYSRPARTLGQAVARNKCLPARDSPVRCLGQHGASLAVDSIWIARKMAVLRRIAIEPWPRGC